ncbi:Alginate export [Fodinibius salinus]|uniref:Alginate export n=1 Tax=Fodinibius salinus TaxID=860790 RepID=A0A5D3YM39_9BACT|nr:alginate export family protein [Fodinibius salinus]TYP94832.1 Alginate export [Fodinibius salinus]
MCFSSIDYYGIVFVLLLMLPTTVLSQVTIEGEFRPRTEYRNGYRQLRTTATEPAFFTSQRTRLSLQYQSENYKVKVAGQDVRVWGEVNQLQDNSNVNIHEAWARINLSEMIQLKMGRQELVYGSQRLLGSVNWTQQARSHDALVLKFQQPQAHFSVDIGGAYNQEAENVFGNTYGLNNYKILSYAWLQKGFGSWNMSALFLTDGFEPQPDATNFRYTTGGHLAYGNQPWKFSGSAYYQSGDDLTRNNISAYMFEFKGSYSWASFRLEGGYDYLSGGKASDTNPARHTFNTLYATNHKFYGHMDYFLNIPTDTQGGGLQDLHLGTNYEMTNKADLGLTYHYFALANELPNFQNSGQSTEQYLGSEFDLSFAYQFSEDISFKLGYSMMLSTSSMDRLQGRNGKESQQWGWVMLQISPDFEK